MIVTETVRGRLLDGIPLAWEDDDAAEVDWDRARSEQLPLSGGEHRLFNIADSLATGEPVDLHDMLTGLDPTNGQIVLQAFAHAMSLDEHTPGAAQ